MSSIEVLISEEDVRARIKDMADNISERFKDKDVVLIGILNGSVFFMTELAQKLSIPVEMEFMSASSYAGTSSTGKVLITKDIERSVRDKHVIIIEDIIDSGLTLQMLADLLRAKNPASLTIVTLLDKKERRTVNIEPDYVGFQIPDEFVVGWGLDYNQQYRNLPFIGIIKD